MAHMTWDELLQLPSAVDLETAGRALGIGRSKIYEMARTGELEQTIKVLKLGRAYRVATAELYRVLGVPIGNEPAMSADSALGRHGIHDAASPTQGRATGRARAVSLPDEAHTGTRPVGSRRVRRSNPSTSPPRSAGPAG